jgi:hypothetical protein
MVNKVTTDFYSNQEAPKVNFECYGRIGGMDMYPRRRRVAIRQELLDAPEDHLNVVGVMGVKY